MNIRAKRKWWLLRIDDIMLLLMFSGMNRIFWNDAATTTRIRMYVSIVITLYLLVKKEITRCNKQSLMIPYISSILLAGIVNYGFTEDLLGTIVTCIFIFDLFALTLRYVRIYGIEDLLDTVYFVALIFMLVNDFSVLYAGKLTKAISSTQAAVMYFSGNKFSVAFIHMIVTFLFCCHNYSTWNRNSLEKIKFLIIGFYNIFFCMFMSCGTGAIGCVLIIILSMCSGKVKKAFSYPATFILLLIILNYLFIGTNVLLSNGVFQNIVLLLGKDLTLTGRMGIYPKLAEIIENSLFFGYGDATQIVAKVVGYGNAQNGILHIFVQYGVLGVSSFIFMCSKAISKVKKSGEENLAIAYPILVYTNIMIVCSLVEICFSYNFLFGIALLNACGEYSAKEYL